MLHNYADWSKYVQRANTSYKQRDGGGGWFTTIVCVHIMSVQTTTIDCQSFHHGYKTKKSCEIHFPSLVKLAV